MIRWIEISIWHMKCLPNELYDVVPTQCMSPCCQTILEQCSRIIYPISTQTGITSLLKSQGLDSTPRLDFYALTSLVKISWLASWHHSIWSTCNLSSERNIEWRLRKFTWSINHLEIYKIMYVTHLTWIVYKCIKFKYICDVLYQISNILYNTTLWLLIMELKKRWQCYLLWQKTREMQQIASRIPTQTKQQEN